MSSQPTSLLHQKVERPYMDKKFRGTREEYEKQLDESKLVYIGRLAPTTTEEQIHHLFSKCGQIKNLIMGLNRVTKTPCGFCFVEYYARSSCDHAVKFLNGTRFHNHVIQVAIDFGFYQGKQFGRGKSGGQASEDFGKRSRQDGDDRESKKIMGEQ